MIVIDEAIQKSDFKDQYSNQPQRSLLYREWRNTDVGRMAREKTTGFKALAKWENDENEDDKQPLRAVLVELNKSHTRDAIREQLDKLSQEEKIRDESLTLKRTNQTVGNSLCEDDDDDFFPTAPKRKSCGENLNNVY
ncbi:hypothetical protein Fcan01_02347 [Folsomia candida]|uniref:Uncharacterized protein n=1 Tax=Folsomia candida TaxID=158441 RepID=A0A226F1W5_FOLCA|nr:hypothetical protein Fcan01_02347 [Folsomia candida]